MTRSGMPAVFMLLVLGGCSFVPVSELLAVSAPQTFSRSGERPLANDWWHEFNDAQLSRLVASGLNENFSLKAGWQRLRQADALARQAGAGQLPDMGVSVVSSTKRQDTGNTIDSSNTQNFGLQASYELDLWGRVAAREDAAIADYMSSAESLNTAAVTLAASITNTWYQAQEQYGQVQLLSSQLKNVEDTLTLIRLRYRYGQVTVTDVMQQEQLQQSTFAESQLAEAQLRVYEQQLNILFGKSPQTEISWQYQTLPDLPALPDTGIPAELASQRPDLRQAWYRYESAQQSVAVAKANRMPAISLSASFDSAAGSWSNLFESWALGLAGNLAAPVFDGGSRAAEVDRTEAVAAEALYDYTQSVLDALGEVEHALINEVAHERYRVSLQQQVKLSAQVFEQLQLRYSKGSEDYLAVLNAQEKLYGLERQLMTAHRQQLEYRVGLYRSLGSGFLVAENEKEQGTFQVNSDRAAVVAADESKR